jgi:endoglucanase
MKTQHLIVCCLVMLLTGQLFAVKIVQLGTASSTCIAVVIETAPGEATPSQEKAQWFIDGASAPDVGRWSYPWYEEKAGSGYAMTMRHHFYLLMDASLQNDHSYALQTPGGDTTLLFNDQNTFCESIKVNQVGYSAQSQVRYANLGIFLGDKGPQKLESLPEYHIIDARKGSVLYSASLQYWGDNTYDPGGDGLPRGSGEHVYRIDLSQVPEGGPYYISVAGFGRSYPFGIGTAYKRQIAHAHLRGLFHQRCGCALEEPYTKFTRAACHTIVEITDAEPPDFITERGAEMEIHGGYHDAGDFDRRLCHTLIPAWLLNTYEAFPEKFSDNQFNLPESGNGIPDFLDEALWGLLVWEYLQDEDGAIRAGTEADRHPTYGEVNAESDHLIYRTYKKYGHTTASGAGLFAHAARLVAPFNADKSQALLERAIKAWQYLQTHEMPTAHAAQKMYAALQLYLATADDSYHQHFITQANYILNDAGWPEQYNPVWWNLTTTRDGMVFAPYFFAYLITDLPVNAGIKASFINLLENKSTDVLTALDSQPYPIGPVVPQIAWGVATNQGRYAEASMLMYRLTGEQQYLDAVSQLSDYTLGLNPLGRSYVTGLGANPPNNPLQLDSYYSYKKGVGNVPGIVIYGPVIEPSEASWEKLVWQKLYPAYDTLAEQRRWCDGWSFIGANEFTTWETMALNVCMHAFLSDDGIFTGIMYDHKQQPDRSKKKESGNFPNPFNPSTNIHFSLTEHSNVEISVYTIDGRLIRNLIKNHYGVGAHTIRWDGRDASGKRVSSGLYIYRIEAGEKIVTGKMTLVR